jgi:hypothetical protein
VISFLSSLPGRSEAGGKRCLVKQLPATDGVPERGAGWYYDDFSAATERTCASGTHQRVAFMPGSVPPTGVTITVQCWTKGQQRTDCE